MREYEFVQNILGKLFSLAHPENCLTTAPIRALDSSTIISSGGDLPLDQSANQQIPLCLVALTANVRSINIVCKRNAYINFRFALTVNSIER